MASYGILTPASYQNIKVCSISLNMDDRIRLIAVPEEMTEKIRDAILRGWGTVQNERNYHGTHEFKLKGTPWSATGDEAVKSRSLLTAILEAMALSGWNLIQAADVSKKTYDKDTLFFEYGTPDPEADFFAISFNMHDRIRVIGAHSAMPYVKEAVKTQWRWGIQSEREYHGSLELKLAGTPWYPDGPETVFGRLLLCQIIANIKATGFKLYGSIDISSGAPTKGQDLESWVFRKITPFWQ